MKDDKVTEHMKKHDAKLTSQSVIKKSKKKKAVKSILNKMKNKQDK